MEQEKSTTLKLIYIILLGGIFLLCRYFFIFEIGIPIYSLGVFTFIILGLYYYSNKRFVIILILNFIAFFIWFVDIWDFSIIPFMLIFTASQILISTIISIITFEIKKVTTYGNGEMKKRIMESLSKFSEYEYIKERNLLQNL